MKHNTNANTMVVVDASLENYQQLIDGIRPGAKSFLLDLRSDGIQQISELLRQHQETEVLHLLSHGSPGCLYLGNSQLSLDTLGDYASTLQKWKVKQLLLYGCNVAAGDAGEELMTKLQALTGASLAASTTRTGAAARGGNWKLEWRTPGMKTPLALSAEAQITYGGILISQQEYQALRALYQSTNGASWSFNTGWRDWNFNSPTPPNDSVVNGWLGVTVANSRVTRLWLHLNGLTGSIPTELGNLSNLNRLWLYSNQLTGSIPTELGNLSNLEDLWLYSNQLTGSIPTELGNLSNLEDLLLYSNQLTGSIPTELGNLSNLEDLLLYSNQLTGSIPQEVLDLSAFKRLENPPYVLTEIPDVQLLLGNNLNIDISANFGDINNNIDNYTATGLPGGVTINSRGVISGTFTTADTFTVTVTATDAAGNSYSEALTISVNEIPQQEYQALRALYQSTNGAFWRNNTGWRDWNFNSQTPPEASILNGWYGVTVVNKRVTELRLEENQLTGSIPTELGNLSNLEDLRLNYNQLTGSIPTELGNLSNLEDLWLNKNQLTGSIPQEVLNLRAEKRLENPPYVKTQIPDVEFLLGNNLDIDISDNFGDINNNINNYTATGLPGGVTINTQGVISGTPTTAGIFTVTVTAIDAIDAVSNQGTDIFDIVITILRTLWGTTP